MVAALPSRELYGDANRTRVISELSEQRVPVLRHGVHRSQQGRDGALFLFVLRRMSRLDRLVALESPAESSVPT